MCVAREATARRTANRGRQEDEAIGPQPLAMILRWRLARASKNAFGHAYHPATPNLSLHRAFCLWWGCGRLGPAASYFDAAASCLIRDGLWCCHRLLPWCPKVLLSARTTDEMYR